ncbi:hypothetical protein RQP46_004078 [Phenoliferia psychrophenolica]
MARGLQKEQSRQKNLDAAKKAAGGNSTLKTKAASLKILCPKCFVSMLDYKSFKIHFEAKHPKDAVPEESFFAAKA